MSENSPDPAGPEPHGSEEPAGSSRTIVYVVAAAGVLLVGACVVCGGGLALPVILRNQRQREAVEARRSAVETLKRTGREMHERSVPEIQDIQSMEATFYDADRGAKVKFEVPEAHWQPILSSLLPAQRDNDPAKWVSLGDLEIKLASGDPSHVSLYDVSDGLGAFSCGPDWDHRVYYRGGSSTHLKKALGTAFEAVEKKP